MTAAERTRIRLEVDRIHRARLKRTPIHIDPAVYTRILAACCPDTANGINAEDHAWRIATTIAQLKGKAA